MLLDHADKQYICQWDGCGMPFILGSFSAHLRDVHRVLVLGNEKSRVRCGWLECNADTMNLESISRHVTEQHCEIKFSCTHCKGKYTRQHNLKNHMREKHGILC